MNCIDSDFAIAILKGNTSAKKLLTTLESEGDIFITSISIFELTYITKEISKKKEKSLMNLIDTLKVIPLDKNSALIASKIGRKLAKDGKMIHPMDLMIGAMALQKKMTIITNNIKHFSRIKGLDIVSW
ncbi:MAG: type II toxin-antitoxin system VapC family toxin [Candidatus Thorarchaeota archaeon]